MQEESKFWQYSDLNIEYTASLDGDGRSMTAQFVEYIKENYADKLPFDCCYEWCSGPGFIGFALLAEKLCKRLVLADINPKAVEVAKRTVKHNNLESMVSVYLSDNLKDIPPELKFDLVVGNPPNYFCLNPLHPLYHELAADLRPNDPDWKIHHEFYQSIPNYLADGAVLCIEEVDPFATKCFMPNLDPQQPLWGPEPFDIRPRPPILDFREMISGAGLEFKKVEVLPELSVPIHVVVSEFHQHSHSKDKLTIRPGYVFLEQVGELSDGSYRLYAMESEQARGFVDLPDDQLWLIDLLELLVISGDEGLMKTQICEKLKLQLGHVESAASMLRNMGWIV